jgi:hypothetical protein
MQSLALENYGTSELSFDEQREIDGGFPPVVLAAWAIMATIDAALIAVYTSYDVAGKLNHSGHHNHPPKPHGEHR